MFLTYHSLHLNINHFGYKIELYNSIYILALNPLYCCYHIFHFCYNVLFFL